MEGRSATGADQRWPAIGAISGLIFVVLAVIGTLLMPLGKGEKDSVAVWATYYADSGRQDRAIAAMVISALAAFFFLWFIGHLRRALRLAEGPLGGAMSDIVLPAGAAAAALVLASTAAFGAYPSAKSFFDHFPDDGGLAMFATSLGYWLGNLSNVVAAVTVFAASFAIARSGILPRWIAIVGYVLAAIALVGVFVFFLGLAPLIWVVVVSIALLRLPAAGLLARAGAAETVGAGRPVT